jgi:hypothetical protein
MQPWLLSVCRHWHDDAAHLSWRIYELSAWHSSGRVILLGVAVCLAELLLQVLLDLEGTRHVTGTAKGCHQRI